MMHDATSNTLFPVAKHQFFDKLTLEEKGN